ncbi:hypothetical protein BBM67_22370 [Vibrio parahaemolyticus]|nr:hypothetical protein BBM67_22370 [Vibrio parahaemolyticus]
MKHSLFAVSAIALAVLTGCQSDSQNVAEQPLYVSTISVDAPVKSQYRAFKGLVVPAELICSSQTGHFIKRHFSVQS